MVKPHSETKVQASMITGICIGIVAALVISAILTAGLTSLIVNGKLGEGVTGPCVFVIRAMSVFIGSLLAASLIGEKHLPIIGVITTAYLLILVGLGIAIYDGSFQMFGAGIMSVLVGGVLAGLIKLKSKRKRKMPARRRR